MQTPLKNLNARHHRGIHHTLAHQIKNFYCVFQYLGRFCIIELHMYVLVRYMIKLMKEDLCVYSQQNPDTFLCHN